LEKNSITVKKQETTLFNADNLRAFIPFLGLILILAVFGIATNGKFTSWKNLLVILNQAIAVMIAGTGVSFVIAAGSLDFSHGSLVAFAAALGALAMAATNSMAVCMLVILGVTVLTGVLNGWMLTKLRVPSFIATMSVLFMFRGLTIAVCSGGTIAIPLWMDVFDTLEVKLVILLAVLIVFNYIYTFTKFGAYCRAVGSGEVAAKYAGVPVNRVKMLVFIVSVLRHASCSYATAAFLPALQLFWKRIYLPRLFWAVCR
jgi:ribose transport system permease protein